MATIKDIAKESGVSKSTVSRVVSDNGFVKKETREKIEMAMQKLNYTPNMFAKGMRTNKSHAIGILFPEFTNPYFADWFGIVDKLARERGYLNFICITDPKGETEEKRLDDLLARNIDGIIMFSYCKRNDFVKKLLEVSKHTPLICSDSMFDDTGLSCVYADGEQGTFDAVTHLIKSGRKRIAYINARKPFTVIERRYSGYLKALLSHGISFDDSIVIEGDFTKNGGFDATSKLMQLDNPPDAIAAPTDYMAVGALEYLLKNGYNVPGDVAVMGFNNQEITKHTSPALSTVSLPINELAKTAINTLVQLIEKPNQHPVKHVFNCGLELRGSTELNYVTNQ